MYIDTVLKRFNMEGSKNDYLSIGSEITLSKKDCVIIPEEREYMSSPLCFCSKLYRAHFEMY